MIVPNGGTALPWGLAAPIMRLVIHNGLDFRTRCTKPRVTSAAIMIRIQVRSFHLRPPITLSQITQTEAAVGLMLAYFIVLQIRFIHIRHINTMHPHVPIFMAAVIAAAPTATGISGYS